MMKSVKTWLLLLVIYVAYLVIGGFLFHYTECPTERRDKMDTLRSDKELSKAVEEMREILSQDEQKKLDFILDHVVVRYELNTSLESNLTEKLVKCSKWDFENSLFFSFTVVTTIGYGHQSTTTPEGRMACLAYAIIGIPLNAILIGALGSVFSNKFKQYKKKLWESLWGREEMDDSRPKVVVVLVESIVFIFFFTSILMLVPAAIFSALEEDGSGSWNYLNSVYYTFITLSTVGFGDMVPDRQENTNIHSEGARVFYQVIIILWIIIGMGYIFAVVDVMADTLRSTSKPVKKALRGIKNQVFVSDYWKRIINEIIEIKQSDIQIDDSKVLVSAGGSEPCLMIPNNHLLDIENFSDFRKTVSTGDLNEHDQLDASFEEEINNKTKAVKKTSEIKIGENFLTVPGGHRRTRAGSPDVGSDNSSSSFDEINEDTITSLRQFMSVAKIDQPLEEWMENNLPGGYRRASHSDAPTRQVSRAGSLGGIRVTRRSSVKSNLSRQSTRTAISGPVGSLLEQTTLGEFLEAVENVRRKSQIELTENIEERREKRPSFLGRLVISRRNSVETKNINGYDLKTANSEGEMTSKEI